MTQRRLINGVVFGLMVLTAAALLGCLSNEQAGAKTSDTIIRCRVEADRAVLPAGTPQKVIVKVTLDAERPPKETERPSVNLALVLDRSGSMRGDKLQKAKDAAIEALRRLSRDDVFSVVAYNHVVQTIVPARKARDIDWIENRIRSFSAGGNTALFGGVSTGAAEVRKNLDNDYVHRVILMSDGIANVGPSSPGDLGRLGAALMKEGISVTTVGVGLDYNEDLMTQLSQNSDGNTYFVENSSDLPRIFAAELGDVLNVVAKNVKIKIICPDNVKPLAVIGRDGRIKGQTVELKMNQLYGGQQKYALLELEVPERKEGDSLELAFAKISYDNPFTQTSEISSARAKARFSKSQAEVKKSVNASVQAEFELNRNALAQEAAINLADKGQVDKAAKVLNKSAKQLKETGKKLNDQNLINKAEQMEQQAVQIENEGMTKRSRKQLRTDSNQQVQQQMAH